MMFTRTLTGAAVAALLAAAAPAQAQTAKDFEDMRAEIRRLRDEVNELKKAKAPEPAAKPAAAESGWGDRIDALEVKSKDAVVVGDVPGSFRLPGSETSIKLYGYAEAHAIHSLRRNDSSDIFTDLSFQALNNSGAQRGGTRLTAQSSRFGFETSTPTSQGTFNTKLEADFYSYGDDNRNRLRLRHAYGEYAGFLVGQTWSTFMDVDNLPETVDFNGPIGSPFSRRVQVRYSYNDPQLAKFTVALEDPNDQVGAGSSHERLPQLVARVDKTFGWGALNLRLLSHEKRSASETKRGYGVGVGGNYKLTERDVLMGQYAYVRGDIDQQYGSNGYDIDATTGAIAMDRNHGLIVGWAHTFNERLRSNVVFGRNRGKLATAYSDNRTLGQLHLNLIYSPIKNVELGGEYVHGVRKTFAGDKGTLSRFDLMGRYTF